MQDVVSPKAVLAISSMVARGSVGLRAAGFAIERLGVPVWKVPTVFLPWHPGHAKTYGVPPRANTEDTVFADSVTAIAKAPFASEVGVVLTGYFASAAQVEATASAIDTLRETNPDLKVVCDPVSADSHGTYVPDDVVNALKTQLFPRATVLTPNRFEVGLFSGEEGAIDDNSGLMRAARALGEQTMAVTSAHGMMRNHIGTLLIEGERASLFEHAQMSDAPHGTGDMLSALIAAHLMLGRSNAEAVVKATSSVFEMVVRSVRSGEAELAIAREQDSLVRPMAMVMQRQLSQPKKR